LAKSKNKHNRIYAMAEPLGDELTQAIEEEKVKSVKDVRERSHLLHSQFDWDVNDAKKVWCFCPETTGANLLVDKTQQAQYLREIRDSIEAGFQWVTKEGVLTHENQRGARYNIMDVMAHQDNAHRGGDQIIPAARRAMYAA
jgi:elongation factor 2